MACGAFPVVSHIPANREWIQHGTNGYLAQIGDVEEFAEAIAMALDSQHLRAGAGIINTGIVRDKLDLNKNLDLMTTRFQALLNSDAASKDDISLLTDDG